MPMRIRHSETADGIALEVELDQHHRLLTHHPAVMSRFDRHNLWSLVFDDTAVGVFDVNLATRKETDVRVHAEVSADNWFHVDRPPESTGIDHALDACAAGASD